MRIISPITFVIFTVCFIGFTSASYKNSCGKLRKAAKALVESKDGTKECSEAVSSLKQIGDTIEEDRYDFCNPSHPGCPNNTEWPCAGINAGSCDTDTLRELWTNCANGWCMNANGTRAENGEGIPWCEMYCPIKNGKPCYDKLKCIKNN